MFVYTEFTKKKFSGQLTLAVASPAHQKGLIPTCNLTGRLEERSTITLLPVRSHSGIAPFFLPWRAFTQRFDSYSTTNKTLVAFWREFHKIEVLRICTGGL